jgi:hypothetical protein
MLNVVMLSVIKLNVVAPLLSMHNVTVCFCRSTKVKIFVNLIPCQSLISLKRCTFFPLYTNSVSLCILVLEVINYQLIDTQKHTLYLHCTYVATKINELMIVNYLKHQMSILSLWCRLIENICLLQSVCVDSASHKQSKFVVCRMKNSQTRL